MNCIKIIHFMKWILSHMKNVDTDIFSVNTEKNRKRVRPIAWQRSSLASLLLCGILWTIGCGKPQLEPHNIHLTASLRTAISTRNADWLAQNIEEIESRRTDGQMGEQEYAALMSIISKAQSGDWEAAEYETLALQKAQRPTKEQMQAVHEHGTKCEHTHTHP